MPYDHLNALESESIFIMREAFAKFDNMAMLWSIGKDSTAMLWLARKAFLGHVPFPLVHVDTTYKMSCSASNASPVGKGVHANIRLI